MADLNIPNKKESPEKFDISPDSPRVSMSLDATYQIEAMIDALAEAARTERTSLGHLVKGVAPRIFELTSVIMSALGDEIEKESELHARLYGRVLAPADRMAIADVGKAVQS